MTSETTTNPSQTTGLALDLGPEAEEFRLEFREWLSEYAPPDLRGVSWPAGQESKHQTRLREWADVLCQAGYMCVAWPREYGGRGLSTAEVAAMNEEFDRAGVPRISRGRAETTVGPAIIAHGTEEQKAYFLPRIISGEHVYCQGFSEPGSGSDLASLRTIGVVDGDELVITGQKVWTSGYYESTMMFALVRTDPQAAKHAGISYVLLPVDKNGPGTGIEFRPIRQLTGQSGFAETFFDGARVPLSHVIGGLNQGWRVTVTTLGHERGNRATTAHVAYTRDFWKLVDVARARGVADNPVVREKLVLAWTQIETMRFSGLQLLAALAAGQDPTERAESGSVTKIRWSEYARWFGELALDILGPEALTAGDGDDLGYWQEQFLSSRSVTIWGGTAEVQRNIIAERVLGLLKEPSAFSAFPKSRARSRPSRRIDRCDPMSLVVTSEQDDLRSTIRRFMELRSPLSRTREVMAQPVPHDRATWAELAGELGVHGIAVPEEYGGSGIDVQTLAHVFEECGRGLLPGPLLATLGLAAPLLGASGDADAQSRYLPGIASGDTVATVAWLPPGGGWDACGGSMLATRDVSAGWHVSGRATLVLDGASADLCLVLAQAPGGISAFAVDAAGPGVNRAPVRALDPTRGLAGLRLDSVPAVLVGMEGGGRALLDVAIDHACVLLAAEAVGAAQACLDMSVAYAKQREQFGRPIGSFQAIKHKCAEVHVEIEGARSCVRYASWAAGANPAELPAVAPLAKAAAADAFFRAAAENVQIHGGIGFTWEHDAHLFLKRAKASQEMFGGSSSLRLRVADRIGI